MKFEYPIQKEDFLAFQLFTASRSQRISKRLNRGRILVAVSFAFVALYFYRQQNMVLLIYFALAAILIALFYPRYFKWRFKKHYDKYIEENYSKRFGANETIELNDDQIIMKDRTGEGKINLTEIVEVSETSDHFFIKISTGVSLIIPKNAISGADRFKQFFASKHIPIVPFLDWKW